VYSIKVGYLAGVFDIGIDEAKWLTVYLPVMIATKCKNWGTLQNDATIITSDFQHKHLFDLA
jgi:hypothetical protein